MVFRTTTAISSSWKMMEFARSFPVSRTNGSSPRQTRVTAFPTDTTANSAESTPGATATAMCLCVALASEVASGLLLEAVQRCGVLAASTRASRRPHTIGAADVPDHAERAAGAGRTGAVPVVTARVHLVAAGELASLVAVGPHELASAAEEAIRTRATE